MNSEGVPLGVFEDGMLKDPTGSHTILRGVQGGSSLYLLAKEKSKEIFLKNLDEMLTKAKIMNGITK